VTGLYDFRNRPYSASLGRWMGQDRGYWDGMNLYQYVGSNPVAFTDPSGLKLIDTGVRECYGYVADSAIFSGMSAHTYILLNGVGYGFYAKGWYNNHNSGGVLTGTPGIIVVGDQNAYPPIYVKHPWQVPTTGTYALCDPIKLDDCEYDIGRFLQQLQILINKSIANPPEYNILTYDCTDWANAKIGQAEALALKQSKDPCCK
jgi:hypothetical protein